MWIRTLFLNRYTLVALATLPVMLANPAFSAQQDAAQSSPAATHPVKAAAFKVQPSAPFEKAFGSDAYLHLYSSAPQPDRWKTDFNIRTKEQSGQKVPVFLNQRGEYSGNGLSVLAEMGDIRISETPNTVHGISRRGGRFGLSTGNSGNSVRFETFASSGANGGPEGLLVGATGEISLLADAARFKTIYVSGRETLRPDARPSDFGDKKGDVLGLIARLEPVKGRLAAEAELNFALYDPNTADSYEARRDRACRVKIGGEWGRYRYKAQYERTGPEYRLIGAKGPKRDSEGVSLGFETAFQQHLFDVKLSRHNNNTVESELYPRVYMYEGHVDYSFKAIEALPLGLRYRKTLVDSSREPSGYLPKETEEDALSGRVNYLAGKWDLGLLASFSQRTDKLREEREATAASVAFSPKFAAGPVTVAPGFSLKRTKDFPASLRTDHYAVTLGINGSALEKKLDYQVEGGVKKEWTDLPSYRKQSLAAKVKVAYPFMNLFGSAAPPTIGFKGEYNGISDRFVARPLDRGERVFTLLLSLEGVSFM